jgi:hypothetical protein
MVGARARADESIMLGYAFAVVNPALNLNVFGSPREVVEELGKRRLDVSLVVEAEETTIETRDVFKPAPRVHLTGGPHAEAIVDLLAAIDDSNPRAAAKALASDPVAVVGGHSGAGIPLLAAASSTNLEIVRMLIAAGAKADATGEFDMTALHWAAGKGDAEVVKAILEAGASLESVSWFYVTPGELAVMNGRESVVRHVAARQGPVAISAQAVVTRMREWSRSLGV